MSDAEKEHLRNTTQMADTVIDRLEKTADGGYVCKCTRDDLEGQCHPDTGVPYVRKTVQLDGYPVSVVVPRFPNVFETTVPASVWTAGDDALFKQSTQNLAAKIAADPSLSKNFSRRQLAQIQNGEARISGYTWHHTENPGVMQLVKTELHSFTRHTGGNVLWCKGKR